MTSLITPLHPQRADEGILKTRARHCVKHDIALNAMSAVFFCLPEIGLSLWERKQTMTGKKQGQLRILVRSH
jgi:hypothetical protein